MSFGHFIVLLFCNLGVFFFFASFWWFSYRVMVQQNFSINRKAFLFMFSFSFLETKVCGPVEGVAMVMNPF